MTVRRSTIELDEALVAQAIGATGGTLRATVEQGLRLLIAQSADHEDRHRELLDDHLTSAAEGVNFEVLLSGEAWR